MFLPMFAVFLLICYEFQMVYFGVLATEIFWIMILNFCYELMLCLSICLDSLHPRTMPWCHLCHSQGQAQ